MLSLCSSTGSRKFSPISNNYVYIMILIKNNHLFTIFVSYYHSTINIYDIVFTNN